MLRDLPPTVQSEGCFARIEQLVIMNRSPVVLFVSRIDTKHRHSQEQAVTMRWRQLPVTAVDG